jgi:VIT1/CCC1 family predicted Fe2+/Mn2+ transporter
MTRAWARPAVFGAFDGQTCLIGTVLPLLRTPHLILLTALGVGLAELVGMAAGEWQSDSDSGLGASLVVGIASALGVIAPAIPFALLPRTAALITCVAVLCLLTTGIAALRADMRGRRRAFAESYAILGAAAAVVWVGQLLAGGA